MMRLFVVNDAPRRMLSRELCVWLHAVDAWPHVRFRDAGQRDEACQYNDAIAGALALADYDEFVFADSDIRPHVTHAAEFWTTEADVVGCRYPTEKESAWDNPNIIHAGLWRTSRKVLETVEPPWFLWEYDEAHTRVTRCLCEHFCRKVRAAGFTVAQGGWAMHETRGQRCPR